MLIKGSNSLKKSVKYKIGEIYPRKVINREKRANLRLLEHN